MRGVKAWVGAHWDQLKRLARYAGTSVVATVVSELTLLAVYGFKLLGASASSVVASLAGMVVSYPMSRYWIWPEADREHMGRQAVSYFVIAIVSLVLASAVTGLAAAVAPSGHSAHVAVVGVAYVGTYGAIWFAKYVVYQRFLFRAHPAGGAVEPAVPEGAGVEAD